MEASEFGRREDRGKKPERDTRPVSSQLKNNFEGEDLGG